MIRCLDCQNCKKKVERITLAGEPDWQTNSTRLPPRSRRKTSYRCTAGHWPAPVCHTSLAETMTIPGCPDYDADADAEDQPDTAPDPETPRFPRHGEMIAADGSGRPILRRNTRAACEAGERPCRKLGCFYHLDNHKPRPNHKPHTDDTCVLDVAARGGITLEDCGAVMGITRERIRQIEFRALQKIKRFLWRHPEFRDALKLGFVHADAE